MVNKAFKQGYEDALDNILEPGNEDVSYQLGHAHAIAFHPERFPEWMVKEAEEMIWTRDKQ